MRFGSVPIMLQLASTLILTRARVQPDLITYDIYPDTAGQRHTQLYTRTHIMCIALNQPSRGPNACGCKWNYLEVHYYMSITSILFIAGNFSMSQVWESFPHPKMKHQWTIKDCSLCSSGNGICKRVILSILVLLPACRAKNDCDVFVTMS